MSFVQRAALDQLDAKYFTCEILIEERSEIDLEESNDNVESTGRIVLHRTAGASWLAAFAFSSFTVQPLLCAFHFTLDR